MDRSWVHADRRSHEYKLGVAEFCQFALGNARDPNRICCPCTKCGNVKDFSTQVIKDHLFVNGIDTDYVKWTEHGEVVVESGSYTDSKSLESEPIESDSVQGNMRADYEVELDSDVELEGDEDEELLSECNEFKKFVDDANKPLYPGCNRHTKVNVLVRLYNLKAKHGMSDSGYSDWLIAFAEYLPEGNEIPSSVYEAKKSLSALGMDYTKIHACPNDCILYRKQYADDTICPTCGTSRWKICKNKKEREGVPAKVLWYFPPIPRFKKMFQSIETSKALTWHATERNKDGLIRHPADSAAWKLVDEKWADFGNEPRNLRLALSTDGFNPFSSLSSKYSCWPVILVTYNLPPWLVMKRKHMMLTLLISDPKQPGNDIDVYLEPLIDDLKLLWEGVNGVYDAIKNETFTLRALLFWTINDFPAYGNLSGSIVKGYNACPICLDKTKPTRLVHGGKMAYTIHWRFLGRHHPYRKLRAAFNNQPEHVAAPMPLTGEELLSRVEAEVPHWPKNQRRLENSFGLGGNGYKMWIAPKSRCKTIDASRLPKIQSDLVETLCELEKYFPPSFFDIMIHLTVHLVREVELCGPVCFRWMYPFERYMKVCKGYVRNKTHPEGCIAECYIAEEALEFLGELFFDDRTVGIPKENITADKPTSGATVESVYGKEFQQAHLCVLQNTEEFRSYFLEHTEQLKREFPKYKKNKKWLVDKQNMTFAQWVKERVESKVAEPGCDVPEIVRWLANQPTHEVPKFSGYRIGGVQYNTKLRDDLRSTQSSGVYLVAKTPQVASAKDKNPITEDMSFYGVKPKYGSLTMVILGFLFLSVIG
ncbi:uncharacterized protein LOC112183897 [Rosa chinensis]|uniref:uncharacterized protein LOC112183897 n=1 Tax=Rosa chinensis TaxID=74649 RepID=UPI000D097356|nr:uncharacterized protein LOC112183897 [Rosa chinensis]